MVHCFLFKEAPKRQRQLKILRRVFQTLVFTHLALLDQVAAAFCPFKSYQSNYIPNGNILTSMSSSSSSSSSEQNMESQQPERLVLSQLEILCPLGSPNGEINLILASQSPRRKEILDMMGLSGKFTRTPSPLDESALAASLTANPIHPVEYTRKLAEEKAKALAVDIVNSVAKPTLVLGSDTIVDLDGHILEKPEDAHDAKQMLSRLSGRTHAVHTGVAIFSVKTESDVHLIGSFTDTAQVRFADLGEGDIDAYIATKEPMDKAGSYGIQGIGGQFVQNVEGDFFTVMGLPMHRTSVLLSRAIRSVTQQKS